MVATGGAGTGTGGGGSGSGGTSATGSTSATGGMSATGGHDGGADEDAAREAGAADTGMGDTGPADASADSPPPPDPTQGPFPWVWTFDSGTEGFVGYFAHNAAEGAMQYDGSVFSGWTEMFKRFEGADFSRATAIQVVFRVLERPPSTGASMAVHLRDGDGQDCTYRLYQYVGGWDVDMTPITNCGIDMSDIRILGLRFFEDDVYAGTAVDSITVFGTNPDQPPDPDPPLIHYSFDGHFLNTGTVSGYTATGGGTFVEGMEGLAVHDGHLIVNNWGTFIRERDKFEITIRYQREQPYTGDHLIRCKRLVSPYTGFEIAQTAGGLSACWAESGGESACGRITTSEDPLTGWHTVVLRWDGSALDVFHDGEPRYHATPPGNPFRVLTTERLYINESDHYGFLMDDIRVTDHFTDCTPGDACCDPDGSRCDFGCDTPTGTCWPECDPAGTCCQSDGRLCATGCNTATGTCWPECDPTDVCCTAAGTFATDDEIQQPSTSRTWKRCALGQTWQPGANCRCTGDATPMSWCNASGGSGGGCVLDQAGTDACAAALGSGYRLPSRAELVALLQPCDASVQANDPGTCTTCQDSDTCASMFSAEQSTGYWSSSEDTKSAGLNNAWYGLFGSGYIGSIPKSQSAYARCLR